MVEIRYGEHYEVADLMGKSVAEAREQYRKEFGIPDRAQAKLNGKGIGKKLEAEAGLSDEDELNFEEKSRRGLVMLGAFLLTLAITGGIFAYTFTTATVTMLVTTASSDFAMISANRTVLTYQPFGTYRGAIPTGNLFNITPASGYTGDLEVTVYLSNPDELTKNYRYWLLRLQLTDNSTGHNPVDAQGGTQVLTMENGHASFYFNSANFTSMNGPWCIWTTGGSYMGLPWGTGWGTTYQPLLFSVVTHANC